MTTAASSAITLSADIGLLMVVPLTAGEQVLGALTLGRLAARPGFTDASLQMASSFAAQAAVALELSRARADQIALARLEDHDRIAADLHDHVIQELFALGMGRQSMVSRTDRPKNGERLSGYVDSIDAVIARIRASIFQLHQPRSQEPAGLQAQLVELLTEHVPQLGFTASIRFAGPVSLGADSGLARDILAVTREALSNCARHARATIADIAVTMNDGMVTVEITDNGIGIGTPSRSSGLANMRRRAERYGGTLQFATPPGGGTQLTWTALVDCRMAG